MSVNSESIKQDYLIARLIETEAQLKEAVQQLTARLDHLAADRSKPPRPLTHEEVAEMYHVKESTVNNWVCARKIPHHKGGGSVIFILEELLNWSRRPAIERRPAKS